MKLANKHMDIHSIDCGKGSSARPTYTPSCAMTAGNQELNWYPTAQEKDFPDTSPV